MKILRLGSLLLTAAQTTFNSLWGRSVSVRLTCRWTMKREQLSPAYTTNWKELPIVKWWWD